MTAQPKTSFRQEVLDATRRAVDHLRARQHPSGWWQGELATNVTMDAEDLLLRQFLGIRQAGDTAAACRWIRSQQRADGTWATFAGGPADLSVTVEAYVALRLGGDDVDAPHLAAARTWIRAHGGLERTRVFTRIWLALFGCWSWDELPVIPPELIFVPTWLPLNVYDFACWARQTLVALTVVTTLRPVRDLGFDVDELRVGAPPAPLPSWRSAAGVLARVDKVLHAYRRLPVQPLRTAALRRAAEWILARQEADGCWGGIQPPWVYSILALHLLGYPLDHPALRAAIDGLEGYLVRVAGPAGPVRRLEACQSPVWDTCLGVIALVDAGVPADDPALGRATRWLLGEEITVPGDWTVRRPGLAPAGWAFEFANDNYPDVDDTAEVVLALLRIPERVVGGVTAAARRGIDWSVGMQSRDGGWGAFDADNTQELVKKLPFCDFGAVIDPPTADVTAHVVEMLAAVGRVDEPAARRGIGWLLDHQEADGSWFGRWGANYVYGTGAVVPALVAAGIDPASPPIRRAVDFLARHQNADGGFGEDLRSYVDPGWRGRGTSTASQTAWALLALLAAGEASDVVDDAVQFLLDTQRPDGGWDEELYTGTGFPGDFYINYEMYRVVFPVTALGRYLSGRPLGSYPARRPLQSATAGGPVAAAPARGGAG